MSQNSTGSDRPAHWKPSAKPPMPEHRSTWRNGLANKADLQLVVCAAQLGVVPHAFVCAVAAVPDSAVITVHCPADLHQRLVCQLMRQQVCQVTPTGQGLLPAAAQQCFGRNAGLSAYGNDNVFDRY